MLFRSLDWQASPLELEASRQAALLAELGEGQHPSAGSLVAIVPRAEMHLVKLRDRRPLPEVAASGGRLAVSRLAFHGELGSAVPEHDEINLALVGVADEPQLHRMPLRVFDGMTVFEEVAGHEILESRAVFWNSRPIPEIQLSFLPDRPNEIGRAHV